MPDNTTKKYLIPVLEGPSFTFTPLAESHFQLLLKWLETPHVKKWWDQDVTYTMDLVREKYGSRIQSLQAISEAIQDNDTGSPQSLSLLRDDVVQGFIIHHKQNPVGYLQIYNAYDFPRSKPLSDLPEKLGAFDIFIGEEAALQQGLGSKAILEFLKLHGNPYTHIFADPDSNNVAAIKAYEKAGFKKVSEQEDRGEVWMLKDLCSRNNPLSTIQKLIKERYSDAPTEWKALDEKKILEELKSREPIFHHPEKLGKTKKDIENQMCDEFWEVGASGNVYTRANVIEALIERYNDPIYQDIWEAKDFALTKIAPDNYLLTYTLIQDKTRVTRRSTIWRKVAGNWKIMYHQGTVLNGGGA